MRSTQDDADLILRLYDMRRDHEMRKARAWFDTEFDPHSAQDVIELVGSGFAQSAGECWRDRLWSRSQDQR
jgi:hypothetical protein